MLRNLVSSKCVHCTFCTVSSPVDCECCFTVSELLIQPSLNTVLIPSHARPQTAEDPAATSQQSTPDNPAPSTEVPPQGATAAGSTA